MDINRAVVITGASSGAGRAIALAFALNKDRLVLASRNADTLLAVEKECRQLGASVKSIVTDTSDYHAVINLASQADEFLGNIDIWINNAGVLAIGEFDETPMEITAQVIQTNLLGYMHGAHAVLPYFKKQGKGTIINNISIGGFLPVPYGAGYAASKFGLRGFSQSLKSELTAYPDIHLCDAYPAFLDTPGIQHAANFTGKVLKPAPPVYDPTRIADAVLKLSKNPKSSTMIGSISFLLRYTQAILPSLTGKIVSGVIKTYLKQAKEINKTDGNVFSPLAFGNAVHGGWGLPGKPKVYRKYIGTGIGLLVLGVALSMTNKKN